MKNTDKDISSGPRIKKPVQKRSRKTRQKIIDGATQLFSELGFEETTTSMIADRSGVAIGTVYAHFKDKWQIFLEILETLQRNNYRFLEQAIDQLTAEKYDFDVALDRLFNGVYKQYRRNGKLNREMVKFAFMDERAEKIQDKWDQKEDKKIIDFLKFYQDKMKVHNIEFADIVIHRATHEILSYLYRNADKVDDQAIYSEFLNMIKSYLVK